MKGLRLLLTLTLFPLIGCQYQDEIASLAKDLEEKSPSETPLEKIGCDPFNYEEPLSANQGLKVTVRTSSKKKARHLDDYLNPETSQDLGVELYLPQVNVPTRKFKHGFPMADGTLLNHPEDEATPLVEWFNLNFESFLTLDDESLEGDYLFATLSDDGVRLKFNNEVYLERPGTHAPTFDCAKTKVIRLKKGSKIPMTLNYFQGPRQHIAVALYWKRLEAGEKQNFLKICGKRGNHKKILRKGWEVVPSEAFSLGKKKNPCY